MKKLVAIICACRTKSTQISRGTNNTAVPIIIVTQSSRVFCQWIAGIIRFIRSFSCFQPVNSNCSNEKRDCIDPRNMSFCQHVCCKEKTNKRQQMTPNEGSKLFKVFFLNYVNFNPFCFGKIKGRKSEQQNRRIEEGEGLIGQKNRGANTKHQDNKHMTPHKITDFLKRCNHDKCSNSSYLHYSIKKVNCL